MPWTTSVNRALHRVTGYMLTDETPEQRREAIRISSRRAAGRARKRAAAKHGRRTVQGAPERSLASHDGELVELVERVRPRTMTDPAKLAPLIEATRHVVRHGIPGDVVECGVWRGGSMQAVAWTLLSLGETDRGLHLFDTFEGMPPPTAEDRRTTKDGVLSAEQMLLTSERDSRLWAVAGIEDVREGMAETGYPEEKVQFHPGMVEDTTPGQAPARISLLRLDTDWYASTKHELEHLYERLSPGGVLILDDYGDWDGARKATDEWLKRTREQIFLVPMGSGRIGIKPTG